MKNCSVKQTLHEKAKEDISFVTDVNEECEETTKDAMKSKAFEGEEIIEKLESSKDSKQFNDLEMKTMLEKLSLSATKNKIVICRVKDEKIVDVMQMDFYSDSEDKNIDHVEENKTGDEDEEDSDSSSTSVATQTRVASNLATTEFICEQKVAPKSDDKKNKIAKASQALSDEDLDNIDIDGIVRKLLKISCDNCKPKLIINEKFTEEIVGNFYDALARPSKEVGVIILRIVPAVAIDEKSGAILGYGFGHLVGYGKNYRRRSKIFRGFAKNAETFQSIFKIINGSLN